MNIDRLNKAATAAGFAMATPDDDGVGAELTPARHRLVSSDAMEPVVPSRALTVRTNTQPTLSSSSAFATLGDWLKSCLPARGWRAPA